MGGFNSVLRLRLSQPPAWAWAWAWAELGNIKLFIHRVDVQCQKMIKWDRGRGSWIAIYSTNFGNIKVFEAWSLINHYNCILTENTFLYMSQESFFIYLVVEIPPWILSFIAPKWIFIWHVLDMDNSLQMTSPVAHLNCVMVSGLLLRLNSTGNKSLTNRNWEQN